MATNVTLTSEHKPYTVKATAANADIVIAAPTTGRVMVDNIVIGFSATPAAATFQILVGAVVQYELPIMATATAPVVIPGPLQASSGAAATLRLTSGGGAVVGYVSCTTWAGH